PHPRPPVGARLPDPDRRPREEGRDDVRGDPDPAGAGGDFRARSGRHREAARLGRDLVDQVTRKGGSAPLPTGGAVLAARTRAASPSKARAKPAHEHRRGLSPPPSLPEQQIAPAEPALEGA